jgi:hypothetical protein
MCSFLRPLNHALNGCLNPKGIQLLKEYDNKMISLFISNTFVSTGQQEMIHTKIYLKGRYSIPEKQVD